MYPSATSNPAANLPWDVPVGYIPVCPTRAPAVVVALRGTLLRAPTFARSLKDIHAGSRCRCARR
jgi:hypothetical protein